VSVPRHKKRGGSGGKQHNVNRRKGGDLMTNKTVPLEQANSQASQPEKKSLAEMRADLEQQRSERIQALAENDLLVREITGALKALDFAMENK